MRGLPALLGLLGAGGGAAYENGAPPAHTGGFGEPTCSACHSDNETDDRRGVLRLDGMPARYRPGVRYDLVVTLEHPALESGGFQLSLRSSDGKSAGTVTPASARTATRAAEGVDYLQHTADGREAEAAGLIRWSFSWLAPATGTEVVLHLAANAANDDLSALGDFVYTLERRLEALTDPGTGSRRNR